MKSKVKYMRASVAIVCIALACTGCTTTNSASGDGEYPSNLGSLTMVVPFAPGGTSDTIARLVAPRLEEELAVPVRILNRSERDGQAGMEELAEGNKDGSIIGFTNLPSAVATYVGTGDAGFDSESYTPVGGLTTVSSVITVHTGSDYVDLPTLVEAARQNPGTVALAAGALDDRVQVSELQRVTGAEFNVIPFEGGSSGEVTALLGRKVDAIIGAPVAMIPGVEAGDVRVVAVFGEEEVPGLPDTRTARSQGTDLVLSSRVGLSVPAGTDPEARDVLSAAVREISEDPEFVEQVEALGYGAGFIDADQYAQEWLEAETLVQQVVERTGS